MPKQTERTVMSKLSSGLILMTRERAYFEGTKDEIWAEVESIKIPNFNAVPTNISLAPRQPKNVKRRAVSKYEWANRIITMITPELEEVA